jgi:hypothetical protein
MQIQMINSAPLSHYAQLLKAAELSKQQDVRIPIQQARLLNIALVELLDKVNQDYQALLIELKNSAETEVVNVNMDGGGFSDK